MSGGKYFCTLDISQAYLHMPVDDESAMLQAISTHKGTYKVKRLMFGIKIAPNVWQRFMDQLLVDIKGVACFFDDIMVQGSTYEELLYNLEAVFKLLRENNLHLNKEKCQFFENSITYLGHKIDKDGLHQECQ
ncbi:Reverse transcriptase (RNA-dependent DNA polymerase) [Popillia japonica]|uniref:Reverse transcriptase (RNA-dependent DNA polymerase) n=1 Tax=Popillia japonica TaxID=7064 RepID=A0AAW1GUD2_POPJA